MKSASQSLCKKRNSRLSKISLLLLLFMLLLFCLVKFYKTKVNNCIICINLKNGSGTDKINDKYVDKCIMH